jgi:hypothetical protein
MTGRASAVLIVCAVSAACCASKAFAQPGAPARHPATRPMTPATQPAGRSAPTTPPPQLPAEFEVLRSHNPFAHGKGGPGGPGAPAGPEAMFVLRGIAESGPQYTAFIEDTAGKRVMELAAGSPVATGRIKSVDIDSIEYEATGATRRISVGQNLAGRVVPPTPTSKPAAPQPPPGGPGPGNGPHPMPPGGPVPPGAKARKGGPPGAEPPAPPEQ